MNEIGFVLIVFFAMNLVNAFLQWGVLKNGVNKKIAFYYVLLLLLLLFILNLFVIYYFEFDKKIIIFIPIRYAHEKDLTKINS
jgi:hypothetical protein